MNMCEDCVYFLESPLNIGGLKAKQSAHQVNKQL